MSSARGPAERPAVGLLVGSDAARGHAFDPSLATHSLGTSDVIALVNLLDRETFDFNRLHLTRHYFRKPVQWDLRKFAVLWNLISDPDQNPETLDVADRLTRGFAGGVINPPRLVGRTRRHEVWRTLAGVPDVHAPKVLRLKYPSLERLKAAADAEGFRFPAIVRRTGTHGGEVVGVFERPEDVEGVYGDRRSEYYVTEFIDVRRADGLYRKTRFFFIGEAVVVRQHIVHDDWSIHGRASRQFMVAREDLLEESRRMLLGGYEALSPVTQRALHAIRETIGLDYMGLDAYVRPDGALVVFEANATMNFNPAFRNPHTQHNRAALPRALDAIRTLLLAKAAPAHAAAATNS